MSFDTCTSNTSNPSNSSDLGAAPAALPGWFAAIFGDIPTEPAPAGPARKRGRPAKSGRVLAPKPAPDPAPAPEPEQPRPPVKAPRPRPAAERPRPAAAAAARAKRRTVNYSAPSSRATVVKQLAMVEFLAQQASGVTVRELAAHLGMSRQLALYHVKKMVALGGIDAVFESYPDNGGVRLRVWDHVRLAEHYVDWLDARTRPAPAAPIAAPQRRVAA